MIAARGGRVRQGAAVDDSKVEESPDDTLRVTARLGDFLESWSTGLATRVSMGLVAVVGAVEISSGFETSLLALYALPIALAAWATRARTAYTLAAVAAAKFEGRFTGEAF